MREHGWEDLLEVPIMENRATEEDIAGDLEVFFLPILPKKILFSKIKTESEIKTKQVLLLSLTQNLYWNLFFRLLFETIHRLELNTLKIRFAVHTVFYRQPCRPAGRCQTGTRNWITILSIGGCCADPTPWSLRLGSHLDSGQGVKIIFLHWLVSLSSNFCPGLHSIHVQKSRLYNSRQLISHFIFLNFLNLYWI